MKKIWLLNQINILVDIGPNIISKKISKWLSIFKGSGISLTNNEAKEVIKLSRSFENNRILLKRSTKKISQKGELLNAFYPLTRVTLPLMKRVLIPLAKSILVAL